MCRRIRKKLWTFRFCRRIRKRLWSFRFRRRIRLVEKVLEFEENFKRDCGSLEFVNE